MMKITKIGIVMISLLLLAAAAFGCSCKKGEDAVKQEEQITPASTAPSNDQIDMQDTTQDIQEDEIHMQGGNDGEDKLPTLPTENPLPNETPAPETPADPTVTPAPETTAAPAVTEDPMEIDPDMTAAPGQPTPNPEQTAVPAEPTATPGPNETPKPTPDDGPIVLPELP